MKTYGIMNILFIIMISAALSLSIGCSGDVFKTLLEGGGTEKLVITPANPSLPLGTTRQLTVTHIAKDMTRKDVTSTAVWESSDDLTATVSYEGMVESVQVGAVFVTATYEGISTTTEVNVTPAVLTSIEVTSVNTSRPRGLKEQFTATGTYSDLTTHDITNDVTWSSANDTIAEASNDFGTKGEVTAVNVGGPIAITAELDGISGFKNFSVTAAELVSIQVTPFNDILPNGTSKQYTATGLYTDNSTLNITNDVDWDIIAGTGNATVTNAPGAKGNVAATANGTVTVRATDPLTSIEGSTGLTITNATLVSITITPAISNLPNGATQQFSATGIYSDDSQLDVTNLATWLSTDDAIASVNPNAGLAKAEGIGNDVIISASYGGKTGTIEFDVTAAVLDRIEVIPVNQAIPKGTGLQFTATGVYTDNTTVDMTDDVLWESTSSPIASISNATGTEGYATGNAVGSVTISATGSSKTGSTALTVGAAALSSITVTPADPSMPFPKTLQFTATGNYTDGGTANLTNDVTWASTQTAFADISNAAGSKGIATSFADGKTIISATYSGKSGGTELTVSAATLESIIVTPTNPSIAVGMGLQFHATGVYSDKSTQDLTSSATWLSSDEAYATITPSGGIAMGVGAGTTAISASFGGKSGNTSLKVTSATLVAVTVTPANRSIANGTTLQYAAMGTFSDSTTLDITEQVTWSTAPGGIASVSNAAGSRGYATAAAAGSTTVTATHAGSGLSGSAVLEITNATLESITITPTNPICFGTTQQFKAVGNYSNSTTQDITDRVTWSSSNIIIAAISNAAGSEGLATSKAVGATIITAKLGAVEKSTTLEVRAATLTSLVISPTNPTVGHPGAMQFTVKGVYTGGFEQDLTTQVLWSSSTPGVAVISNAAGSQGLATSVSIGSTSIKAERDGIPESTSLKVEADTTAPIISSVTRIDSTKVRISFSEAVNVTQAKLVSSYKITATPGGLCDNNSNFDGATQTPDFSINSVTVESSMNYVLNLSAGMQNITYTVLADKDEIRDISDAENPLGCPNNMNFTGFDVTPPTVASATSLTPTTVRVTFSENVNESEAENASNYLIVNAPESGVCSDNTNFENSTKTSDFDISSVSGSGKVYDITLSATQVSGKSYTVLVDKRAVHDRAATPILLGCPNNADFTGLEQLKVTRSDSASSTSFIVTFSKAVLTGVDAPGTAGCTTVSECAKRYYAIGTTSLGPITRATILDGSVCNGATADPTKVCVEHDLNQGKGQYTVIVANNVDGDNFNNNTATGGWGSIRDLGNTENVQVSPKDRATFNGAGGIPQNFTDGALADDPFGDSSAFGYLATFDDKIYIGPNAKGNAARRFKPDGTDPEDVFFEIAKDTTGGSWEDFGGSIGWVYLGASNNSATTRDGGKAVPPYVTIGYTGCTPNNADLSGGCGPNNEDGRGLFTSGIIGGVEHLFITGGRSAGFNNYMYWTTETNTSPDYSYIDLENPFENTAGGAWVAGNRGTESITIFNDKIYWMAPGDRTYRPYLMKVFDKTEESANNTNSKFMMMTWMPGIGYLANSKRNKADMVGGTMYAFNDRLYIANSGSITDSSSCDIDTSYSNGVCEQTGGIIRSNVSDPAYCTAAGTCNDWTDITPATNEKFKAYFTNVLTKLADIIPADQPIPGFAQFKHNGTPYLYMIRNACTTSRWDRTCTSATCTDDVACSDAQSVPQLWKCIPGGDGHCDAADWSLVAESGSTGKTNFGNTNNTKITFIAANGSRLYIGFDNASDGITVWRTKDGRTNPSVEDDFEQIGGNGFGNSNNQQIFSAVSLQQDLLYYLYLSVGKSGVPVKVFRQQDN